MRGFFGIALVSPKKEVNVGGVLRAISCFDANFCVIESQRKTQITHSSDTSKTWRHVPIYRDVHDLFSYVPYGTLCVGVDLVDNAKPLETFVHPERALYIFGPEDGTLGKKHLDKCQHVVKIKTKYCLNLAAAVNVVLYDRSVKFK